MRREGRSGDRRHVGANRLHRVPPQAIQLRAFQVDRHGQGLVQRHFPTRPPLAGCDGGLQGPQPMQDVRDLSLAIHERLHHLQGAGMLVLLQGHFPPEAGDGWQVGEPPEESRIQTGHSLFEIDEVIQGHMGAHLIPLSFCNQARVFPAPPSAGTAGVRLLQGKTPQVKLKPAAPPPDDGIRRSGRGGTIICCAARTALASGHPTTLLFFHEGPNPLDFSVWLSVGSAPTVSNELCRTVYSHVSAVCGRQTAKGGS